MGLRGPGSLRRGTVSRDRWVRPAPSTASTLATVEGIRTPEGMIPRMAGLTREVPDAPGCPLLGLAFDPRTRYTFPHAGHRCFATNGHPADAGRQATYCLSLNYAACDRYRARHRPDARIGSTGWNVVIDHRRRWNSSSRLGHCAERPEFWGRESEIPWTSGARSPSSERGSRSLSRCPLLARRGCLLRSAALPKTYEAKATLIVGQSLSAVNPDYTQLLVSQNLSTTYAAVATTRPILDAVITQLGLGLTSDELLRHVQADAPLDSTLLTITAQDADPARAAAIANAMADQLIAASPAIQGRQAAFQASIDADLQATQDQITTTQAQVDSLTGLTARTPAQDADLATLEGRLVSLRSTYATLLSFSSSNVSNLLSVVEPAVAPTSPVSPRPLLNTLLAAVLGLLAGGGHRLRHRVPRRRDQGPRRGPGGRWPEHPRHDRADAGRPSAQRDLPAGRAPLPALRRRGGVPDAADEHRVRVGRRADPDPARHELDPGRRQDRHRGQPGRRVRPGRPAGPPGGRGPAEAGRPPGLRPAQHAAASRRCCATTT